ncbi:Inner membrane ALBINO3-like protein 1, chloroplastic [Tetrabaena socialis]|uniref:Inner membrane ALBINO3-like protein 1, chloroplastic n=1 Tax=Tetrabaena socialis TaxID=47790 RepID=A0A2J8A4N6_9CHLO|nr:Inner membrane ALBINO3-like protein 1, chloroplastic [Tetrabaena socialis]|eukprot:PNH07484.1 Inner membrane ALBINO3-like protein 1, chloroplastic [Tetrabaena socialis]
MLASQAHSSLDGALQRLGAMYVLADASASTAAASTALATAPDAPAAATRAGGWVAPLADSLEQVLYFLQEGLDKLHVPYSYGYSIILLTLIVKIVTYPLTKQQDENANTQRVLLVALPLMIGWFALNVPSGLSLYYLSNTALSAAQQIYLKKLGGATFKLNELGPVTKPGSGRRAGEPAAALPEWRPATVMNTTEATKARAEAEEAAEKARDAAEEAASMAYDDAAASGVSMAGSVDGGAAAAAPLAAEAGGAAAAAAAAALDASKVSRRCKRRRLTSLVQDGGSGRMVVAAEGVAATA